MELTIAIHSILSKDFVNVSAGQKHTFFSAHKIVHLFDDERGIQCSLAASPLVLFVYQSLWEYEENLYPHNASSSRHHSLTREITSPLLQIVEHKQLNYVSALRKLQSLISPYCSFSI